jgi:hypothetical protein
MQITIKELGHQDNLLLYHRDNQQVDKIIHNQIKLHKQLLAEVEKKNIDFQDQKKVKKIMEIHHQARWEVLIILVHQLQKIIILNKKLQTLLLHHLTEV